MKYFVIFLILIGVIGTSYAYEPVPVGVDMIEYGIFDPNDNNTHLLKVGYTYDIKAHFKSELDKQVRFKFLVQVLDKDKHWTEPVDEFVSTGTLQPNESKRFSFSWTPQYQGEFRTYVEVSNPDTHGVLGYAPQYDFEVVSSNEKITSPNKINSNLLEAQESMRTAFNANVNVEGYPIKHIVIGHGAEDAKYIVHVNADFFNSKHWPDIKENLTSIIGNNMVEIEYREGESLNICGEGTELVNGVCQVVKTDENPPRDCLIATASYGSELAPQVQMLREIRDNTLLNTQSGTIFMNGFNSIYYSFSPTVSQWENENDAFKEAVKLFITPMITTLSIMTITGSSEIEVLFYGISTLGIIVGLYIAAPITLVWKVGKRN